jgi:SNF2 family DNA or RNA helicase
MGLNLTAAHTVMYLSNDYSLKTRLQSEDRVHRPGQTNVVSYYDVVATGPDGQKTIDHHIIKALREKNDIATWTTSAWLAALRED